MNEAEKIKIKATIRTYALVAKDPIGTVPNFMFTSDGKPIIAHTEEALGAYLEGEGAATLAVLLIGESEITFTIDPERIAKALGL